ncbi:MAG: serine hydrolase, partial [Candidatus Latescibacterota bacterium]
FAHVNGNTMMYAASLPKIAVLLAAHQSFQDRVLEETPEKHRTLTEMIRVSSNASATRMIDELGYERIASVLTRPDYRLYDPSRGGGLWVGKRYAKSGERRPDPMRGLSHAATVTQVCRFYYMLATGRLVSPERCRQMLEAMVDPAIHHKFVRTLERTAPNARLYRKSGTWRSYHSDSVLVWGDQRYIAVALVEHPAGDEILEELAAGLETCIRAR